MKKNIIIVLLLLFLVIYANAFNIIAENSSPDEIQKITDKINFYDLYIDSQLQLKLDSSVRNIEIYNTKEDYSSFLSTINIPVRDDFIFLSYNKKTLNKLALYNNWELMEKTLPYHLTIQYFDAFSDNIPKWYKTGYALFFQNHFNNNAIVDTIKNKNSFSPDEQSFALFYYLFNTKNLDEKRVLWDSLSYIRWSTDTNKTDVLDKMFSKIDISKKSIAYLQDQQNLNDKISKLISLYKNSKYNEVVELVLKLETEKESNYAIFYYAGLSYSKLSDYDKAHSYLTLALDNGAPEDITYYAIGANFYTQGDYKQAYNYLSKINSESKHYKLASTILESIKNY